MDYFPLERKSRFTVLCFYWLYYKLNSFYPLLFEVLMLKQWQFFFIFCEFLDEITEYQHLGLFSPEHAFLLKCVFAGGVWATGHTPAGSRNVYTAGGTTDKIGKIIVAVPEKKRKTKQKKTRQLDQPGTWQCLSKDAFMFSKKSPSYQLNTLFLGSKMIIAKRKRVCVQLPTSDGENMHFLFAHSQHCNSWLTALQLTSSSSTILEHDEHVFCRTKVISGGY